ncbi:MAG: glycoside hydrolase family 99-like domain-containing protein [Planctomycetia bacterium]|nr:glycoside hydrolase family 99-like domain-containing protein [Planctomycetia bacterium]
MDQTRRSFLKTSAAALLSSGSLAPSLLSSAENGKEKPYEIGAYYFPNYHVDARNEKQHGKNWTEWTLVEKAVPRFPGHKQPHLPLWGTCDEADPKIMEMKIDAAADYGLTYWIFDWYYYNDGPFLQRGLEEGYLKAKNNHRIKFCTMWANHDWVDIHPWKRGTPRTLLYPGAVSPETFEKIIDVHLSYFKHPSYFCIDGKPYFSVYDLSKFLESFGGIEQTRKAVNHFRDRVKAAGFPDLHLNAVVWGRPVLPVEKVPLDPVAILDGVGFDSTTSYVWIHHVGLPKRETPYDQVRKAYFDHWDKALKTYKRPYYPNVSAGWDSSPRTVATDEFGNWGYPYTNIITGNTPAAFEEALRLTKEKMDRLPNNPRILNINSWNEWTEGSYLEPDRETKFDRLRAIRNVFGKKNG